LTSVPPWSGLASPFSTTLGTGPVRSADPTAGTLTGPPRICTEVAVPGALAETSLSPSCEVIARKTPARPPATSGPLGEGPSTNALEIETPFLDA
jgi:hypothetical protein